MSFKKNLANNVTSWECKKRCCREFKVKIKLDEEGNFLELTNSHTHAPSETKKCEIAKVTTNIERRATEIQDLAQAILRIKLGGISEAGALTYQLCIT